MHGLVVTLNAPPVKPTTLDTTQSFSSMRGFVSLITPMTEPWANCRYLVPKDAPYDRWRKRWDELTARLDAVEQETELSGTCDPREVTLLVEGIKHTEILRENAAMMERWDLDPGTLHRIGSIKEWSIDTVSQWLGLTAKQREKMGLKDMKIPPDVVVRVAIPLALPHITCRKHRAWVLTVGEIISAFS